MPKTVFAAVTFEFEDAPGCDDVRAYLQEVLWEAREKSSKECLIDFKVEINEVDEVRG